MSSISIKKIVGIAISLIVMDLLFPIPYDIFLIKIPSIRRLNRISKKIKSYR